MADTFRALCAELVDIITAHANPDDYAVGYVAETLTRARAALADEPAVPQGREPASVTEQPSDEEIMGLMPQQMHEDLACAARAMANEAGTDNRKAKGFMRIALNRHAVDLARAVLARWGNPAPAPPVDGEVAELVEWLQEEAEELWRIGSEDSQELWRIACEDSAPKIARAAELLQRQALVPVPVAERPWEREGWCDAEGRCWIGYPGLNFSIADTGDTDTTTPEWGLEPPPLKPEVSRCWCLPAHAMPVPEVGE